MIGHQFQDRPAEGLVVLDAGVLFVACWPWRCWYASSALTLSGSSSVMTRMMRSLSSHVNVAPLLVELA